MAFKFKGTPKNWRYQPKTPVLIQSHFETQTAQYIEPKNTPEINENHILSDLITLSFVTVSLDHPV